MVMRQFLSIVLLAIWLAASSCVGLALQSETASRIAAARGTMSKRASAGGVDVRVAPLMSDEESQDLFEANLPLSGILPVRVELVFESGVPVEIKRARFRLRDGEGTRVETAVRRRRLSRAF